MPDIQAAAERWNDQGQYAGSRSTYTRAPQQMADMAELADYGARCATLVPQLVAALKQIRAIAEKQIRNRVEVTLGWSGQAADTCVADSELIWEIDAAIAAGRDCETFAANISGDSHVSSQD